MRYEDWHTHNSLCKHAIGSIEDYVKQAIKLNLNVIGISDHFPYEYLATYIPSLDQIPYERYAMSLNELDVYVTQLEQVRNKYDDQIEVRFGFELDYFKDMDDVLNNYLDDFKEKMDYLYGSVHVLFGKAGIFAFDDSRFLNKYEEYTVNDEVYLEFYTALQNMIASPTFDFDIITHFDLPKKFDKRVEDKTLVMDKVIETLELAKKSDLTIEINTSGLRKQAKEQYPSEEIIKEMYALDIPILLGSDAHNPEEIAFKFKEITALVKSIGYNHLAHFKERKRSFIDI